MTQTSQVELESWLEIASGVWKYSPLEKPPISYMWWLVVMSQKFCAMDR